jgi:hypothetical protein
MWHTLKDIVSMIRTLIAIGQGVEWAYDKIAVILDQPPLPPFFLMSRRIKKGFKADRKQPDPNPTQTRSSDKDSWPTLRF